MNYLYQPFLFQCDFVGIFVKSMSDMLFDCLYLIVDNCEGRTDIFVKCKETLQFHL